MQHIDPVGLLPKIFAGEATPQEQKAVDDWIAADHANREEYDAFSKLWNLTTESRPPGEIDVDTEWHKIENTLFKVKNERRIFVHMLKIAAVVVMISALAFVAYRYSTFTNEKASSGKISQMLLPDGSTLILNAGSSVTYKNDFGKKHRNIKLKGEAWFEVNPDKNLPFIISAGDASVRVTGTKFNVRAYHKQDVKVTVTEGTVRLSDGSVPASNILLNAGETGIMDKNTRMVRTLSKSDLNDLAWRTRIMEFHNTSLDEVADIISNTYHCRVELDERLKSCTVTVRFENRDLEAVLNVLQSTLDLKITKKGKQINISGKGC